LSGIVDYFVVIYLDDILIYFKLKEDYYTYVRIIIKRLRKYKLYIKPNKCFFNVEKVEFLKFKSFWVLLTFIKGLFISILIRL